MRELAKTNLFNLLAAGLALPLLVEAQPTGCEVRIAGADGESQCQVSESTRNPLWPYPVPPPSLEEPVSKTTDDEEDSEAVRKKIAEARRLSAKVIDGYSREIDQCRFDSNTLHFDDREQVRLIGNDQPCQNRYWHLIRQERAALKRRISEIRGRSPANDLHPAPLNP